MVRARGIEESRALPMGGPAIREDRGGPERSVPFDSLFPQPKKKEQPMRLFTIFSILFFAPFALPPARSADTAKEAFTEGKAILNIRYRLESVDQNARRDDALASTLRTRLGFQTASLRGWSALVEFEDITVIGDTNYNDTINGEARYPVVADPRGTELNRAQISYGRGPHHWVLGRQRIALSNHRFVGNVGWRQNEQTFDGIFYRFKGLPKTTLSTYYLENANRIFGEDHPTAGDIRLQSFLGHADIALLPGGTLALFAYFFDNESAPLTSHSNLGARFHGSFKLAGDWSLIHDVSYVKQSDYGDGADRVDADYYALGLGPRVGAFSLTANLEVLGGDGVYGFSTPFATLHAFNGWSDQFLSTPAGGLSDLFLNAGYKANGWNVGLQIHRFEPDESGPDYGEEYGLSISKKLREHWLLGGKYADFQAESFGSDTRKAWLYGQLTW